MRHTLLIVGVLSGALLAGCSDDSPSMMSPVRTTLVGVSPPDGATGVRLDGPITLTFSSPVNRAVVQREVHLISEIAIADSVCPDSATMEHPDMEHCMADSAMMRHLDERHATSGTFSWNAAGTECTFQPAEWMTPSTRQMIHMGRELTDMLSGSMDGMMGGHGSGPMSGNMLLHFTTMDASGGGHDGHH